MRPTMSTWNNPMSKTAPQSVAVSSSNDSNDSYVAPAPLPALSRIRRRGKPIQTLSPKRRNQ